MRAVAVTIAQLFVSEVDMKNVERDRIFTITYDSRIVGEGKIVQKFKFKRMTNKISDEINYNKAVILGGMSAPDNKVSIDAFTWASLKACVEPLFEGADEHEDDWLDEITFDVNYKYFLMNKLLEYQNSFLTDASKTNIQQEDSSASKTTTKVEDTGRVANG